MSFFLVKSLLASALLAAALGAFFSMMTMMGKAEKKIQPQTLRKWHKICGLTFLLFTAILGIMGLKYWAQAGDQLPLRGTLHVVLALTLVILLALKVLIVKLFKQFLKTAPTLGMILFVLTVLIFCISAGFYFLRSAAAQSMTIETEKTIATAADSQSSGDPETGKTLFAVKCASCHFHDKEDTLFGPGLAGFLKKDTLPVSGRKMTEENIIRQIGQPVRSMPAFPDLTKQELADLMAFIRTL